MNPAEVTRVVSKLRYKLSNRRRKLKNIEGPKGRHDKIRKVVTALFKHERLELNYNLGDESRGYAERLISDAIRYGPNHKETMDMASYWLTEKQLVHKLFKVLVPRYEKFPLSYTKMWKAPNVNPCGHITTCVLELRNNIYPPLGPDKTYNKNLIHNVLLKEAKKFYEFQKTLKLKEEHYKMSNMLDEVPNKEAQNNEPNADVLNVQNSLNELKLKEESNENSTKNAEFKESNENSIENAEFKESNENSIKSAEFKESNLKNVEPNEESEVKNSDNDSKIKFTENVSSSSDKSNA